ncbi:integral membrane protein [Catenulispora acidiphila DSM 44928]|uniref:Integral membrane protein n=1 Tax=Catenulispora acidiphila (strain DSM 44928 / JCM 14897 / NBRC 102108 / NRRL B-24433 / ID139908) TaxID=479433 RepID=C7QK34_CATAD|nr:SHOCT domain-containing protein [Catenulispora acidiphila]ACU75108.1 integral membrane protein [Catenulispora acidiphila DSM 44928]
MSHPLLNAFWMIFWFFLWVMWLMLLFRVVADVFGDKGLSGWGKTAWLLFVLVLPFIGVFVYLITRGRSMAERTEAHVRQRQQAFDDHIRETAGTGPGSTTVEELSKLADLKSSGAISDAEFERAKDKLLA